jgi:hypothetical protein
VAQTVKITPATGLLEFIGDNVANKPVLQHDNAGNLTLTLQSAKKFTIGGNLKVNGKVTMAQQTLTDGAAITWDFNSGANAKVTIAGARTLVIANMEAGDTGLILVKQDAAGGRTLTLPGSSSIVGGGSYTASSAANATDVLGVYYDGTTYWWTIGYNTVTPPLTSVGITGSDFVIANSPLTSNGNIGLALATVNSNVGTFGSATAVPVITVNGKGLITAVSATNISIPTNLDSLTDVTISLEATGQLLQFNGSQWVNWTPNYVPTSRTLSINGTSYDLSANRAWTIDTVSYVSRVQHGVKAAVAINKGQAVYVTSADGTNMIVSLASNGSEATSSKTMGLLDATVAINGMANVVTEGLLAGLDTSLAGTEGDPVWLGDNGNLIYGLPNKPYAPRHLVFIGIVTRKNANTGEIFVKVQNGFELKEIHDVDLITTVPVNGHILGYDGTLWVNKTIAGWLGFTPANDANVVHTTGNESIAGIKTFSGTTQATSTTTGTIVTAGGVGIAKNLYVGGDLNVVGNLIIGGTTTTVYAQNLAVSDNMIYLNNGIATTITNAVGNGSSVVYTTQETHNYIIGMSVTITGVSPTAYNLSNQTITGVSTNSFTIANSATGSYSSGGTARAKSNANPDLGFAAGYNDGSYAHAGLFRDATDNTWKFFKGYTPEPDASPFIDTSHASFALADLAANDITGRSFIKVGGTSSQFLKADGSVDSNTYLTTGTASTTYQPLDGDLTAIAGLTATGFLKRTGTNTWTLDSNVYLTAESDTLASVTGRGATTNTASIFTGGLYAQKAQIDGNYTTAALWTESYDNTTTGIAFHISGNVGKFLEMRPDGILYWDNSILWNTNNLTNLNQLTNGPGYITSASLSGYVPTSRTLTINGTTYDLSANRSWTITAGVSSVSAGTGISVNSTTGAVTVTNTGLLSATAGTGITVSTSNQNLTINTTALLSATAGTGITVSTSNQNLTINTTALLSATAGTGITVSTSNQNLTINNTGLLSAAAGTGITVSTSNQQVTINNTGLLSAAAGSGISVSTSNQQVTITNTITNNNQLTNGSNYITTNGRAYPRRADGTNINFYWTGQSGQPSWLWGSNNGEDFYVWNPSNFSVAYASEAKWISFDDGPRDLTDRRPNWNNRSVAWDFVTAGTADGVGNYAGVMTFSPWDGTSASTGDSSYQLAFINETGLNASGVPGLRLRNGIDSTWNDWYQVWHSGNFTNNSSNWNTAYSKRPTALAFSGTGTKTLTLTLGDSSTLTASFSDIDTDTNTDAQTLTLNGSTLSISGGNSITLPSGGISQGTADSLYVNVTGDSMSGNLYVYPSSNPAQIQLVGTNPELYVSASTGTSRVFINRQASGNQATLMFTTGMNVSQGVAWDYTGMPMWSMGMTNNNNTDSFKLGYGDIYEPTSVALEITTANVAYFRNVPYGGGSLLATQSWVTSQGYITGYTETDTLASVTGRGNSTSTTITSTNNANVDGANFTVNTTNKTVNEYAYKVSRSGSAVGGILIDGRGAFASGTTINGNTAWHAGNDGSGSGLDADLLDGYNSDTAANVNTIVRRDSSGNIYSNYVLGTYFNASQGNSENPTIGQIWTQNTSDNYLRKSTPAHFRSQVIDGYYLPLGGGTITGTVNFSNNNLEGVGHIIMADSGFGEGIQWEQWFICDAPDDNSNTAGNLQFVYVPDNGVRMTFDTGGTLTLSNRLIELSSIRYKTNVESLTPALDKVLQLRPVYYTKIGGTGSTEIGLIAEEVAEIYPELIKYDDAGQVDGINYTRIAPILIKTIQEQQELIKNLTKRIDDLENR